MDSLKSAKPVLVESQNAEKLPPLLPPPPAMARAAGHTSTPLLSISVRTGHLSLVRAWFWRLGYGYTGYTDRLIGFRCSRCSHCSRSHGVHSQRQRRRLHQPDSGRTHFPQRRVDMNLLALPVLKQPHAPLCRQFIQGGIQHGSLAQDARRRKLLHHPALDNGGLLPAAMVGRRA